MPQSSIYNEQEGDFKMQLGILIGLVVVLGLTASFLSYFISKTLNSNDSSKVDEVPENYPHTN